MKCMATIKGRIICHNCLQVVNISTLDKVGLHCLPFNGDYCPICPTTGKIINNGIDMAGKDMVPVYAVYH